MNPMVIDCPRDDCSAVAGKPCWGDKDSGTEGCHLDRLYEANGQ